MGCVPPSATEEVKQEPEVRQKAPESSALITYSFSFQNDDRDALWYVMGYSTSIR